MLNFFPSMTKLKINLDNYFKTHFKYSLFDFMIVFLYYSQFVFQISMIMAEIKERFVARLALQRQLNLLDKVIVLALEYSF